MRFNIPPPVPGLQTRLTVRAPSHAWSDVATVEGASVDVEIPGHIVPGQVEAFIEYVDQAGEKRLDAVVLKTQDRPRRGRREL